MSPLAVAEIFRSLAAVLGEEDLPWYVFGAQAVLAYGVPRLTADIDITIDPRGRPNADVLELLERVEIQPRAEGFEEFLLSSRLLPLCHRPSAIAIDIVLASEGIDLDFLDRAVRIEVAGVLVPVLSIEDLIATKIVAGRRKDREDIRGILDQRGDTIDLEALRAVLRDFDDALEEPRAVRRFERLFDEYQRRRTK